MNTLAVLSAQHTLTDADGTVRSKLAYAVTTGAVQRIVKDGGVYTMDAGNTVADVEYRGNAYRMLLTVTNKDGGKDVHIGTFDTVKKARDFFNAYIGASFAPRAF